jgi:Tyrosine-protein kinase ephrin type A/B receptor-like
MVGLCLLLSSLLLTSSQVGAQASEPCPMISEGEKCPAGCWLMEIEIDFPLAQRQCSSVGYGYFSKADNNTRQACPPGTFSDKLNAQVCQECEAGSYSSFEGSHFCNLCPSGFFSAIPGSDFCRSCLDDYYQEEGANAVEYWEDEYYCMYIGSPTTSTSPTASPSASVTELTAAPSPAPTVGRSEGPTTAPSLLPSLSPSRKPSTTPSDRFIVSQEEQIGNGTEWFLVCGELEDYFEWHGHCKKCPSKVEEGLYPFLIVFLFVSLITVLQSLVPLCSTSTVWAGMEYLQVLYLISLSGISWSPFASVVFDKVIPVFALDFSANFSIQCLFGWPQEYDQIFMITLPLVFWLVMTALSKLSRERLVAYKSGLRWLVVYTYLGFASLLQTSKSAADLTSVFSTLFSQLPSTTWYAALAGCIGLAFYGLVFPYWLYRSLGRYYKLVVLGIKEEDVESQATCSCFRKAARKIDASQATLFLTLGIFPSVREGASWWPLFWLVRKMAYITLLGFFPRSPNLVLMALFIILFFSEVFQRCKVPFPNECEERLGNKWYHSATVDTVLQLCAVGMIGLSFLIVGSDQSRSSAEDLTMDVLIIILLSASVLFWLMAVGFVHHSPCEDCPCFATQAAELLPEMATSQCHEDESQDGDNQTAQGFDDIPLDDDTVGSRSAEVTVNNNAPPPRPFGLAGITPSILMSQLAATRLGREIDLRDHQRHSQRQNHGRHSPPQSMFHREDSVVSSGNQDEETVVVETWIDSETGQEVRNTGGKQWADAETGRRLA